MGLNSYLIATPNETVNYQENPAKTGEILFKRLPAMTDKQILEEVYRRLKESDDPHGWKTNPLKDGVTSFIEQEWQKHDDDGLRPQQQSKALGEFSKTWYEADARREDERHRGLEIGEDGTVTGLE